MSGKARKQFLDNHVRSLFSKANTVLLVDYMNVGSRQMAEVRISLRGKATIFVGKKTMIKAILRQDDPSLAPFKSLIPALHESVGLVFCDGDCSEIKSILEGNKVPAPARQGAIAPVDCSVPAGPTGMDPSQTNLFQAMGIPTKIVKGQIEIQSQVQVVKKGEKVSASAASLLQKLNIKPFFYGLRLTGLFSDGRLVDPALLDITADTLLTRLKDTIASITAISLAISYPTVGSMPHMVRNAYKNALALAAATDYSPPELEALLSSSAASAGAPAPANAGATSVATPAPAAPAEPEEEEEMGFSLFD